MKDVVCITVCLCVLCICIFGFSGCSDSKVVTVEQYAKKDTLSMFVEIEETHIWKVVYHKDTKVMYVVSYGDDNRGNFTVLLNADGTPMLYGEE